jgi:hypothetical protein
VPVIAIDPAEGVAEAFVLEHLAEITAIDAAQESACAP